ncbi:Leucyl/phenylalanyl-tRNA--protein transferase [hydrothermal vent metagenome]|uniref:Leucyl/phenylalanyl-tRNA--protein transferase n=1 Tax=hydrothermal vent metagenome TaxID=652676 RepID=A0A3B0T9P1_9ZZZZ
MKKQDPFALELSADLIVRAYKAGIFPMAESETDPEIFWVCPEERGIIVLDEFKISKSLRKILKRQDYTIKIDHDFAAVIDGCAHAGGEREETWINPTIKRLYGELFEQKICHTVEVWQDDKLIGGLYGLAIGAAFFGESMFSRRSNASKIALAHLVRRLDAGGYSLLDTQFISDHLRTLGAREIPRQAYELLLNDALGRKGDFYRSDGGLMSEVCLHETSHKS